MDCPKVGFILFLLASATGVCATTSAFSVTVSFLSVTVSVTCSAISGSSKAFYL
jgi:hypothetical protein